MCIYTVLSIALQSRKLQTGFCSANARLKAESIDRHRPWVLYVTRERPHDSRGPLSKKLRCAVCLHAAHACTLSHTLLHALHGGVCACRTLHAAQLPCLCACQTYICGAQLVCICYKLCTVLLQALFPSSVAMRFF